MFQRIKYLLVAIGSIMVGAVASGLMVFTRQSNVLGCSLFVWGVAVVLAIACINGYADSKARQLSGKATGLALEAYARIYGVKRSFAGWEFDSRLARRIVEKLAHDRKA